jgi:hypothetical protein
MRLPRWAWSAWGKRYLNGIDGAISVLIVKGKDVLGNLLGAVDVGKASVDEMGLSVLLHLQDGSHEALDHGFVVDEAFVQAGAFLGSRIVAGLDVGVGVGEAGGV